MITLYNSQPESPQAQGFAALLEQQSGTAVRVRPLSELPAPDTARPTRQQLRTELAEAENRLTEINRLVALGERNSRRYAQELAGYKQDRERHELLIHVLKGKLGQEGGQQP